MSSISVRRSDLSAVAFSSIWSGRVFSLATCSVADLAFSDRPCSSCDNSA